ncbi:hypothetical protein BDV59DRAFT_200294 [Aspergillus ambiguus]|uniref:Bys1 family protein n=1 Tax=Aspergillus ambiguus TaxID=176160 RepID=UPI003CCD17AC
MHFFYTLLSMAPLALANPILTARQSTTIGQAVVDNECSFPVYLWSVSSTVGSGVTLEPFTTYSEEFRADSSTGGVAIKVTTTPEGLYTGAAQTIFAYSLIGNTVYYDLSDVYGDAFKGNRVSLGGAQGDAITWEDGVPPSGSQVRTQASNLDVVVLRLGVLEVGDVAEELVYEGFDGGEVSMYRLRSLTMYAKLLQERDPVDGHRWCAFFWVQVDFLSGYQLPRLVVAAFEDLARSILKFGPT